jgi:deazaflavin-dependent oxidoreductase (nitroreductase family)
MTPFQERLAHVSVQTMTGLNTTLYRLTNGRVSGRLASGAPICLLTATGRRTRRSHTVPLVYLADGNDLVVVASRGGMSTHPAWYLNVLAHPDVVVEVDGAKRRATARVATAEERERLWPALVAMYVHFAAYQQRTDRQIPVVILSPPHG